MSESRAVELLRTKPRIFWGHVVRILIERGWRPPAPDERIVDDLIAGMEVQHIPNDPRDLSRRRDQERTYGRLLTPSEAYVLELLRSGKSNAEIADELGIAEQTVKFHLSNLYRKLGVRNRTEAVLWEPESK